MQCCAVVAGKFKNMAHLVTVPNFVFDQENEDVNEYPVTVAYYNGSIELSQRDNSIILHPDFVKQLFKEIIKHQPEAEKWLERR